MWSGQELDLLFAQLFRTITQGNEEVLRQTVLNVSTAKICMALAKLELHVASY
jgi:hypothetical protein